MATGGVRLDVGHVELSDWRWLLGALRAHFACGSLASAAGFVNAIAQLAESADSIPDLQLGPGHVALTLRDADMAGVTERQVRLAEQISALALDHGVTAHPGRTQALELALDTPADTVVRPFWVAILGTGEAEDDVVDPFNRVPPLWFQQTDSTAPDRLRFHLDVSVPPEVAQERIAAAIEAGGRVVDASHAPAFVVLADADGNKACISTALGRD